MKGQTMIRKSACALALAAAFAQPAAAQLSSPSTAALGMGDNYTAAARGYSALAWNPANLGLSGNRGSSFQIGTVRGLVGVDPISIADISDYGGRIVPVDVKTEWLRQITEEGSQQGTSGFDSDWLALQVGRFAFQASTTGRAIANFSPGIARLLLFGNTDANGTPQNIDLSNSSMDVNAYTTGALGYAMPFAMNDGKSKLSVGVTAKYTVGHFMAMGDESTGQATANPIAVTLEFPIVHTPFSDDEGGFDAQSGSGFGLDLGAAFESGAWTFGAVAQNLVNTFEWDADKLFFRPGSIVFNKDSTSSSIDSQPYSSSSAVPAALRARVDELKFKPVIAAGAAYQMSTKMRVTGDVRLGSAEGIRTGPKTHAGAGIEYRLLSWLPVRVGAAYLQMDDDDTGSQIGGGLGIDLGGFNVAGSAVRRSTGFGHDTMVMFTLLSRGM